MGQLNISIATSSLTHNRSYTYGDRQVHTRQKKASIQMEGNVKSTSMKQKRMNTVVKKKKTTMVTSNQ